MKGKGAQLNVANRFSRNVVETESLEGIDEPLLEQTPKTEVFLESPKKIITTNTSPDIGFSSSINPYQGCEHGCVYCYARNSHEYWGFSAGLDFESKIIVKKEAARLLEKAFLSGHYKPKVIMLSGNTDCYQPLEKKYEITRKLLSVFNKYKHPVGIITKNALVTRDLDILQDLAASNLVHVNFSITTQDEQLRRLLEPRTASVRKKYAAMELLAKHNIPVGIMNAPIVPGLNDAEIPSILKEASNSGASFASYTVVRLNGQVGKIFQDWLIKTFPDRADKVWRQIQEMHNGAVNDSNYASRLKGEGKMAEVIRNLFELSRRKYFEANEFPKLVTTHFRKAGNYSLF